MEQIFKTIDKYPTASNIGLWIMAALMAWAAFNYEFTTTL
jgi:hypothetical protein